MKNILEKYVFEPMLLTSIAVSFIGILWLIKREYVVGCLLLLNGISSYLYHYDNTDKYVNYDIFLSASSFLYSAFLAKKIFKEKYLEIITIVVVSFLFYTLNIIYNEYYFHLIWHIMVLFGQVFLLTNL